MTQHELIFAYARLSFNPDGSRSGVQRQVADLNKAAESEGIAQQQLRIFREDDRSAYSTKPRPEFERMLREIAVERPRAVWFWKLDRGFRRGDDWQRFLTVTNTAGTDWRSLKDGLDTSGLADRDVAELMGGIFVWQAGKESKNTSVRQQRKQEELALEGKHSGGGSRAFGLNDDWSKRVPTEARLLKAEAKRLLAGASVGSVCTRWNAAGVETTGSAARWTPTVARRLFTSWRLAGAREWEGRLIVTGAIPAILDLETVERLRAKLLGETRPEARSYLLSGLCYCGACGHRLHAKGWYKNGRRYVKFWCPRSLAARGCGKVSISYEPLEESVVGALLQAIDRPELIASANDDDTDYGSVREELATVRERLAALAVDRYAGEPPMADFEYVAARKALLGRQEGLLSQIARQPLREIGERVGDDPLGYWNGAAFDDRHDLLRLLIEKVTIVPAIRLGRSFDTSRIAITWAG